MRDIGEEADVPVQRRQIVVDWGTSNFRAYLFGADGAIDLEHQAAAGILSVSGNGFEQALEREIGSWLTPGCHVFLSGMITSRNGWLETPYVATPADLAGVAAGAREITSARGARLRFLPGVATRHPLPDVMRGEEIQIFGSIAPDETITLILPGTHSKWVRVERGAIAAFRTFLTGELFALLKAHSIVGRLIPNEPLAFDAEAFLAGVRQAASDDSSGLLHDVFTARSGALLGDFGPEAVADRLSGLVIGHELRAGLALGWAGEAVRLVGEPALCARYRDGLAALGQASEAGPAHAAVAGFRRLAALEGGAGS
ncbi:MAG: 2-dehydro-3-deoxygalactonokinase [Methylocystis sp.]|nr:2-dehydro-3-deoxygalactonokinase [Methylocystis sp.]